jgi:predicted PurR-regulated permease PerM
VRGNLTRDSTPLTYGGHVSPWEIALLIVAGAFVLLVLLLAIPLLKLGRTLDEATIAIRKAHTNTDPIFTEANTTLTRVNTQLERVDGITANTQAVTGNVSALTSVFTATLGGPLVKAAAFSYGVSKALKARRRAKGETDGKHARRGRRRGAKS